MKTLIINNHTKHLEELIKLFPESIIVNKEDFNLDLNVSKYDLIIISGGSDCPTVLRHPEMYTDEITFIKTAKIPILGICLGMEIIATTFNSTLKETPTINRGIVELTFTKNIHNFPKSTREYESHKVIVDQLSKDLEIIAFSKHGPEIIKHKTLPIIGLQFHPEITSDQNIIDIVLYEIIH